MDLDYVEIKDSDVTLGATNIPVGGTSVFCPNQIAVGITKSTRVGGKIQVVHLGLKFQLVLPATALIADGCDSVRMIVFLDTQANGALASITDVLTSASINAFYNRDTEDRFLILKDSVYALNTGGYDATGGNTPVIKNIVWDYFCEHTLNYVGSTAVIPQSKSLGYFFISANGLANVQGQKRCSFTDA